MMGNDYVYNINNLIRSINRSGKVLLLKHNSFLLRSAKDNYSLTIQCIFKIRLLKGQAK